MVESSITETVKSGYAQIKQVLVSNQECRRLHSFVYQKPFTYLDLHLVDQQPFGYSGVNRFQPQSFFPYLGISRLDRLLTLFLKWKSVTSVPALWRASTWACQVSEPLLCARVELTVNEWVCGNGLL